MVIPGLLNFYVFHKTNSVMLDDSGITEHFPNTLIPKKS